ncbi:MAG TPA: PQQ-binding-like beta-propeller repeat protein [Candidatus Eremiobacteraeota bacterium]|nr:PQQ-binding-like beta-propeller repeat protein [Candidatus Eremiobacteraeota bacterium]
MKHSEDLPDQLLLDLLRLEELNNPKFEFKFLWKFKTNDNIIASPVFENGIVFVNSSDGYLYAINGESSEELWKRKLLKNERDLPGDSTPVVSDDRVYVTSFRNLYVVDAKNGNVLNEKEGFFNRSSLTLIDRKLFVRQRNLFCAYSTMELNKLWEFQGNGYLESSPLIKDDLIFLGSQGCKIYALDIEEGKLIWEFETEDAVEAKPSIYGDTLFIGSRDQKIYALNCFDGTKKWSIEVDGEICSFAPVYRGAVYVATVFGNIYAFNVETGKLKWKSDISGTIYSSPVIDKGIIYIGSSGRVKKFNAISTASGQVVWDFDMEGEILSSPSFGINNIYVTSMDGYLYSFLYHSIAEIEEPEEVVPEVSQKIVRSCHTGQKESIEKIQERKSLEERLKLQLKKKQREELEEKLKAKARERKKLREAEHKLTKEEIIEESSGLDKQIKLEEGTRENKEKDICLQQEKADSDDLVKKLKIHMSKRKSELEDTLSDIAPEKTLEVDRDKAEKFFTVARTQLAKKMLEPAIISFQRAIELYPDNISYLMGLGKALKEKGDLIGTSDCYEKAMKISPENEEILSSLSVIYQERGKKYLADGYYDEAFDCFIRAMEIKEDGELYFTLADIYILRGDLDNAVKTLTKGLNYDRNNFDYLVKLAELYSQIDIDSEVILDNILTLAGLERDTSGAYFMEGIIYEIDDWEKSISSYEKAIEIDANFTEVYYRMGILFLQAELYDEAEEVFEKCIHIEPSYVMAYNGLGRLYIKKGRMSDAKNIVKKAISLDPECFQAKTLLARIFLNEEDIDGAVKYINKIEGIERSSPEVNVIKGEMLLRSNSEQEGVKCFLSAINSLASTWDVRAQIASLSILIHDYELLNILIEVFKKEDERELLIPLYERILFLKPDINSCLSLARIYRDLNKFDTAIDMLRKFIAHKPDEVNLEIGENYYRRAKKEFREEKLKEAITSIRSAIKFAPNKANYHKYLGDIYFKVEKYFHSVEAYLKSNELEKNSYVFFKLAQAYEKLDKYKKALKNYEEALSLDSSKESYFANLARVYYKTKQYAKAMAVSREALDKFPSMEPKMRSRLEQLHNISYSKLEKNFGNH